jgi:hypothetical protein
MKASQLRAASALIEQLDLVMQDLEALAKLDAANVVVHAAGKQLKYKPLKGLPSRGWLYGDFLRDRKTAIEKLLLAMGVTVNE